MTKRTVRIALTKMLDCNRCGRPTTHTLYDVESKIYKCNVCGTNVEQKSKKR